MIDHANLAKLANELIALANASGFSTAKADIAAHPLIDELIRLGYVNSDSAFVPWGGVREHGIVPVQFFIKTEMLDPNACMHCLNVDRLGNVTVFA